MTQEEWFACTDPKEMLDFLRGQSSPRKMRLFAVACFCHDWDSWQDRRERNAVITAERLADGMAGKADCEAAHTALIQLIDELEDLGDLECIPHVPEYLLRSDFEASDAQICVFQIEAKARFGPDSFEGCVEEVQIEQAGLLRDIFGDPFRPVALDPRWRTSDVLGLARGIYEDRAFERLPILADALMDAGCEDEQILNHCRSEDPHVRGCWVVDTILGKT